MPEHVSIVSKYFDELTTKELYEILKARAEIFVVEQNCVYQDLDDVDYWSLHIFCKEDGTEPVLAGICSRKAFLKSAQR